VIQISTKSNHLLLVTHSILAKIRGWMDNVKAWTLQAEEKAII